MIQGISLRHLRFFLAVAQEASVRRAAERLPTDASNLSRAIRELEHRLGNVSLLDRRRRPLQLTPAGLTLARQGRELERQFLRVVGELRSVDADRGADVGGQGSA